MRLKHQKTSAFTLVEIMVVVAVIGILVAVAIPSLVKARELSQKNTCLANLKLIDSAITSWAVDAKQETGSAIDTNALVGSTNFLREMPFCPGGGQYTFGTVGIQPQIACNLSAQGHMLR